MKLYSPPGKAQGAIRAWAALTQQQSRWRKTAKLKEGSEQVSGGVGFALHTRALLPGLLTVDGDAFLAMGGQLLSMAHPGRVGEKGSVTEEPISNPMGPSPAIGQPSSCQQNQASLCIWLLGKDANLQERLRALAAYHYGTESGVDDDTPNPWGLRLALWRTGMIFGGIIAAIFGGALAANWIPFAVGLLGVISGGLLFLASFFGTLSWMKWRSLPKDTLERSINGPLLRVSFALQLNSGWFQETNQPPSLELLTGEAVWRPLNPAPGLAPT
jgi:hypothetical protein